MDVEVVAAPLFGGVRPRVLVVAHDISERRAAAAILAQRAALLAHSEAISHTGSWHLDLETGMLTASDELFRIFGLGREVDGSAQHLLELFNDALDDEGRALLDPPTPSSLRDGLQRPFEYRIVRPDGTARWVHAEGATEVDLAGRPTGQLGILQDITERRELDEQVTEGVHRLSRAQRAARAGLWDLDLASGHLDWSPELYELLGIDSTVAPSFDAWAALTHPDDRADASARIVAAVAAGSPMRVEFRLLRPAGETRWIQVLGNLVDDADGQPLKMAGICIDITERKLVEQSLEASTAFSRQVIESAREGIVVYGPDLRFQAWNPAMEHLSGRSAPEVLGRRPDEVLPPAAAAEIIGRLERVFAGEIPDPIEMPFQVGDRPAWATDTVGPLCDASGQIIGAIATVQDITSRKAAEQLTAEQAFVFRESQRVASIGSYRTDFTTGTWRSSEVLDQLFGIDESYHRSVEGWLDIVHPDDRDSMASYLQTEVIEGRQPFNREYRITRVNDGETRWVSGLGEVAFDVDGRPLTMIGTIADITDRKRADEDNEQLQLQLQQAQRMEALGRLAGGVAHDFNNMLGAILGYAELALGVVADTDPVHADLVEIRKAATRSAALTRQLLAFARRQSAAPRVIDLNATVESMLSMLRRLIGVDVPLAWHPGDGVGAVYIDPSQVDQVLTNLCVNARDAIDGAGVITIETRAARYDDAWCAEHPGYVPGEYSVLAVADTGGGMDGTTLSKIFEPFFTTKDVGVGTGLGLAMVHGIVTQNEGFIQVTSAPGEGTTFEIHLRRHPGVPADLDAVAGPAAAHHGGGAVLLVEDEPALLAMTRTMLERLGYDVTAAGTPEEAIRLAEQRAGPIDLLVTDVVMPVMNGRDLARRLRDQHPDLRVLFMSGYPSNILARDGVMGENVAFLQKPFSLQALAAAARAALEPLT